MNTNAIPKKYESYYNDTCIAICFFSPFNYTKPKINLSIVLNLLEKSSIPYYTIELLYPNQQNSILNPTLTVRSNSVIFSKENLWNILETKIPKQYTKIIFMDSDIIFSDTDWFNKTSVLLNYYKVIQPMEFVYRDIYPSQEYFDLSQGQIYPVISKAIANKYNKISGHPGHAVAIQRDFFHQISGFPEDGINGYGDGMFWGFFHNENLPATIFGEQFSKNYKDLRISNFNLIRSNDVAYLPRCYCLHLNHGKLEKRKYLDRNHYIPSQYSLYKNTDGVLEIEASHDLIKYWEDRLEDE